MKKGVFVLLAIILLILTFFTIFFENDSNSFKKGDIYISEVLFSNSNIIKDNYGEFSDYIEIYNDSNIDINLNGYYLSDKEFSPKKYTLPDIIIKSKEYVLVYCSGKDKVEDGFIHTNFKLNKDGETVVFTDKTGNILSKINYGNVLSDISISYIDGQYLSSIPTPLKENKKFEIIDYENIFITEYMTHNKMYYLLNGGYYDFVEIYNKGDTINLENLYLSDDENNLYKYKFPNYELEKDSYVVVYLTGKDIIDNYLCANFKLSDDDKYVIISSNDKIIDKVDLVSLKDNLSYGLVEEEWFYFSKPTPGMANTTAHFKEIDEK